MALRIILRRCVMLPTPPADELINIVAFQAITSQGDEVGHGIDAVGLPEDADLPSSVKTALKHTWPRLQDRCKFFTEEAQNLEIVSLFFDRQWWSENLSSPPPRFGGCGYWTTSGTRW